jgi:uracil phosphoribosyltransferase
LEFTPVDHPLVQEKLRLLRDVSTSPKEFRALLAEVSVLLAYEALRDLPLETVSVETPVATASAVRLRNGQPVLVPILRAGLGMSDGILRVVPEASVGHIGLYRDHDTHQPVEYYRKLPADIAGRDVLLLDPMLATGGSAVAALDLLKSVGVRSLRLICLVAAPEGVRAVAAAHPDVPMFGAALDSHLNQDAYIVPGLGDAGDRLFGTL